MKPIQTLLMSVLVVFMFGACASQPEAAPWNEAVATEGALKVVGAGDPRSLTWTRYASQATD